MRCLLIALVCAVLLMPLPGVQALELPLMDELSGDYERGETLRLDVSAELEEYKALSAGSLPALADWLKDLSLQLDFSKSAYAMRLERAGETLLSLSEGEHEGGRLLVIEPTGTGFSISQGEPLAALLDEEPFDISPLLDLPIAALLADVPPDLVSLLKPYETAVKRSTTVKNAGVSPRRLDYQLSAQEWNALWPDLCEELLRQLDWVPLSLRETLEGLRFEQAVSLKRLLNGQDEVMGWQLNTTVKLASGQLRKLSFISGFAPGGGWYINLKTPATSGNDRLNLAVSTALEAQSLKTDVSLESRLGTERYSLKGALDLKWIEDRLSGRMWAQEKRGSEAATRLTIEPDFLLQSGVAQGKVSITAQRGDKPYLALALKASLGHGEVPELPDPSLLYELDSALPAAQVALVQGLLPTVRSMLMDFPEDVRLLLLHDMGRTARTQGETVSAFSQMLDFVVTEDAF